MFNITFAVGLYQYLILI